MTPEQAKKLLADGVIQAFAEGRKVEWRVKGESEWMEAAQTALSFGGCLVYEYRVKPEPRRIWVRFLNKRAFEMKESLEEFPVCPSENEIVEFAEVLR